MFKPSFFGPKLGGYKVGPVLKMCLVPLNTN